MNRSVKHAAAITTILGVLGIVAAGCLDRDVISRNPSTNTTFTTTVHNQTIDKVDLLFMIDNSPSMGDKQTLLALAVPNMIQRLLTPNCLDANKVPTGMTADQNGNCPSGSTAEFTPVHDMHIGILSSSLGSRGGDVCPDTTMNPANPSLSAHDNDNGELINRGGVPGMPTMESAPGTTDAPSPLNFLSYFPPPSQVPANAGHPMPPTPPITTAATLVSDFSTLIAGVHEHGCGFESQNEAWYRFLVQPDPFQSINKGGNVATLNGVDSTILKQRANFLRPDSLLAIIVVTDENEESADPLTIAGQGWAFDQSSFPGSQSGGGAPQGTIECQQLDPNNPTTTGPNDKNCTSCAFLNSSDPSFATRCPKNGTAGNAGYLDPSSDAINLRFWHMRQRFGLFAGYPTSRYVRGLQKNTVPSSMNAVPPGMPCSKNSDCSGKTPTCTPAGGMQPTTGICTSDHEHDGSGNYIGDQDGNANCVNPIYATNLPSDASGELCALQTGPRTPDLVYYAAIAGVPHQLLQAKPGATDSSNVDPATGKPLCAAGTPAAQCPQKFTLADSDWMLIMGKDPEHYDFRGADFHMVESETPRTMNTGGWANAANANTPANCQLDMNGNVAVPCTGPNVPAGCCDPVNGSEFNTANEDLEFSCTFPLVDVSGGNVAPFQKDCTQMEFAQACDCASTSLDKTSQLCSPTTATTQLNAKAYPSVREMIIAHAMSTETINGQTSNQGIVSSLCPINLDVGKSVSQAQGDPLFGYNPAVNAIINRLKASLSNQCIPQKLNPDVNDGTVQCLILVTLPAGTTSGATCKNPGSACATFKGLVGPGGALTMANNTLVFTQDILNKFCDDQEAAYTGGGGKAGGMNDPANVPVCAMQQVVLDKTDSKSCAASGQSGWCYVQGAGAIALNCPEGTIVFTAGMPPHGATTSLQCLESAIAGLPDAGATSSGGGGG